MVGLLSAFWFAAVLLLSTAAIDPEAIEEQVANGIGDRELSVEAVREIVGFHLGDDRDHQTAQIIFTFHALPDKDLSGAFCYLRVGRFGKVLLIQPG